MPPSPWKKMKQINKHGTWAYTLHQQDNCTIICPNWIHKQRVLSNHDPNKIIYFLLFNPKKKKKWIQSPLPHTPRQSQFKQSTPYKLSSQTKRGEISILVQNSDKAWIDNHKIIVIQI